MATIREADLIDSIADALQYISYFHPPDFIRAMADAWAQEESPAARDAMAQILVNSRMAAIGRRPICQDTGLVNVFLQIGCAAQLDIARPLQEVVDDAVRRAWRHADNPLRASVVVDPLGSRRNSADNTPAMLQVEITGGDTLTAQVSAKGGGSENKARFAVLDPSASVADWVVDTVAGLGAGWCPPGMLGIGVGGSADRAMLLAKQALNDPIDMAALRRRGPQDRTEALRLEIHDRVNALGIGAQGLGGLTTVLDVKIRSFPTHAASLPVALIPNCAATRHVQFTLDGSGPARLTPPDLADWPDILLDRASAHARRIDLDHLTDADIAGLIPGETLLLNGTLYTGRDAAHKRLVGMLDAGHPLPVDLRGRAIYYTGPVEAVGQTLERALDPLAAALKRAALRRADKLSRTPAPANTPAPALVSPLAVPFPAIAPIAGVEMATGRAGFYKHERPDLLLMRFAEGTTAAGVFTRHGVGSAPVDWCQRQLAAAKGEDIRALVVNAGCANSFTGKPGADAVRRVAAGVAKRFDCRQRDVMAASTGVIGVLLDDGKIVQKLPELDGRLTEDV